MREKIGQIIAQITGHSVDEIMQGSELGSLAGWDSSSHINIILKIEEKFSLSLDFEDLLKMNSFASIVETMESKIQS